MLRRGLVGVRAGGERGREGDKAGGRAGRSSLWRRSSRAIRDTTASQLPQADRMSGDRSGEGSSERRSISSKTAHAGRAMGPPGAVYKAERLFASLLASISSLSPMFSYSPSKTCTWKLDAKSCNSSQVVPIAVY